MTITSFEPTSRCAILPSGDTLDLVRPGISRVVGFRRGVAEPEYCRFGGLEVCQTECNMFAQEGLLTFAGCYMRSNQACPSEQRLPHPCQEHACVQQSVAPHWPAYHLEFWLR